MKTKLVILIMIAMATPVFANDPNTMEIPTLQNRVTFCIEEGKKIVTIKILFVNVDRNRKVEDRISDENIWSWVNDPDFEAYFYKVYLSFPSYYGRAIRNMTKDATWSEGKAIFNRVESEKVR